jgi:hypothetical protein
VTPASDRVSGVRRCGQSPADVRGTRSRPGAPGPRAGAVSTSGPVAAAAGQPTPRRREPYCPITGPVTSPVSPPDRPPRRPGPLSTPAGLSVPAATRAGPGRGKRCQRPAGSQPRPARRADAGPQRQRGGSRGGSKTGSRPGRSGGSAASPPVALAVSVCAHVLPARLASVDGTVRVGTSRDEPSPRGCAPGRSTARLRRGSLAAWLPGWRTGNRPAGASRRRARQHAVLAGLGSRGSGRRQRDR